MRKNRVSYGGVWVKPVISDRLCIYRLVVDTIQKLHECREKNRRLQNTITGDGLVPAKEMRDCSCGGIIVDGRCRDAEGAH